MRLLVVGHSYLTAFAQCKYVEMKRQSKDLELRLLTPRIVPHLFQNYIREVASGLTTEEVVDIREFFGRSHMTYILNPLHFIKVLREFQPDRIHIEEDPYSAIGVETVFLARIFCRQAKISFFIWDNLARELNFPFNIVKWSLNRYSLDRSNLAVCGNKEGESLLHGKKNYKGKTAVLPQLGLDEKIYFGKKNKELRDTLNISNDMILIGYVGRLIPEKGVLLLLEALKQLLGLSWRIIIIGGGPLEAEITEKWQAILGERMILRKPIPHTEVPDYIRAMDILVLPSYTTKTWKEQFGLVLAQAMLAGVPCIGSSSGAIPDVIGPGGLVFEENNIHELVDALKRLIENKDERSYLGKAAKLFAHEHYTHTAVSGQYLDIFTGQKN